MPVSCLSQSGDFVLDPQFLALKFGKVQIIGMRTLIFFVYFFFKGGMFRAQGTNVIDRGHASTSPLQGFTTVSC